MNTNVHSYKHMHVNMYVYLQTYIAKCHVISLCRKLNAYFNDNKNELQIVMIDIL